MKKRDSGQKPSYPDMASELPPNAAAFTNGRMRVPLLCEILRTWTDADHGLTLDQIANLLTAYYGDLAKPPSKPTLIEDLRAIEAAKLGNCKVKGPDKGSNSGYRCMGSSLSPSQARTLIHLAQTSKFITEGESRALCEALSKDLSHYEKRNLVKQVHVDERAKSTSSNVFYVMQVGNEAIENDEWLRFEYCRYDFRSSAVPLVSPDGGTAFTEKPLAFLFSNGCYYLETRTKRGETMRRRLDRMRNLLRMPGTPKGVEPVRAEDAEALRREMKASLPRMFDMLSGERRGLFLRVRSDGLNMVYDRFGFNIHFEDILPSKDGCFETGCMYADLQVSSTFFRWLFGLGDKVRVVPPPKMNMRLFPESAEKGVSPDERLEKLEQDYAKTIEEYKALLQTAGGFYETA